MFIIDLLKALAPFIWTAVVGNLSVSQAIKREPYKVGFVGALILSIALNLVLSRTIIIMSEKIKSGYYATSQAHRPKSLGETAAANLTTSNRGASK